MSTNSADFAAGFVCQCPFIINAAVEASADRNYIETSFAGLVALASAVTTIGITTAIVSVFAAVVMLDPMSYGQYIYAGIACGVVFIAGLVAAVTVIRMPRERKSGFFPRSVVATIGAGIMGSVIQGSVAYDGAVPTYVMTIYVCSVMMTLVIPFVCRSAWERTFANPTQEFAMNAFTYLLVMMLIIPVYIMARV